MSEFLGVISHPMRIRIIEELNAGDLNVQSLQDRLGIAHSAVSQHLSLMKAHDIVQERRVGRQVFYKLKDEGLAGWLVAGLVFIIPDTGHDREMEAAIQQTKESWDRPGKIAGEIS